MSTYAPRARRTDPETSHQAARFANSQKAASERLSIYMAVLNGGDMTAREIAHVTGLDYIEVQRRISEVTGLRKPKARVWGAAFGVLQPLKKRNPLRQQRAPDQPKKEL